MIEAWVSAGMAWLSAHPHFADMVIFFIAFTESLAIVGLIVPGSVALAGIGVLVGAGVISLESTLCFAILGAILGDGLSFALGKYYQGAIETKWPHKKIKKLIQLGRQYFEQHGGKSIFFARFVGPIRPVMPMVAGMLNVSWGKFLLADVTSGILWAPAYIVPGMAISKATTLLAGDDATLVVFYGILIICLFWLFMMGINRLWLRWWYPKSFHMWQSCFPYIETYRFATYLSWHQHNPTPLNRFLLGSLSTVCFVLITLYVWLHNDVDWLQNSFQWFQSMQVDWLSKTFFYITLLGEKYVMISFYLMVLGYFMGTASWYLAGLWFLNGAFVGGGTFILKAILAIERPTEELTRSTFSYPSAHVALIIGLLGFYYLLLTQHWRTSRFYILVSLITISTLIILSRLYLGAHWITDVAGGSIFALAVVQYCGILIPVNTVSERVYHWLLPFGVLALSSSWLIYYIGFGDSEKQAYQLTALFT